MSTQHNFNRFPFALAGEDDSAPRPSRPDLGEVENIAPEFDALPADLGDELDSLAYGRAWAGYA